MSRPSSDAAVGPNSKAGWVLPDSHRAGPGRATNEWAWTGRALQITLINGPGRAGP